MNAHASTPGAAKLDSPVTLHELLMNLGEACSFFRDGRVDDQTEYYEACCTLLGIPQKTEVYTEVIVITSATGFVAEFVRGHREEIIGLGWLAR